MSQSQATNNNSMSRINIIFGTAGHNDPKMGFPDEDSIAQTFETLEKYGIWQLDTAIIYGNGTVEATLGKLVPKNHGFTLDTKWPGYFGASKSDESTLLAMTRQSLKNLQVDQVDIFYLHSPDPTTPLEETCKAVDRVYQTGAFKRFGISNFSPADVQRTYDICRENGYVLPSVFQGIYSPINRVMETELLPVLRKLNMSFYAYSPLAGGFLTKTKAEIQSGAGRFNKDTIGGAYLYFAKPGHLEILSEWEEAAAMSHCSKAELAYRWVTYNSALKSEHGDSIIIGANGNTQLKETLTGLQNGPLDNEAVQRIQNVWDAIKHESKLDWHS